MLGSSKKWIKKETFKLRKENKRRSIYRECLTRMTEIKRDRSYNRSKKGLMISEHKRSTQKCSTNKRPIDKLRLREERKELKTL